MAKEDIVKYQFDSNQSRTKAAENGRKGGIASGKAKRERKLIKERILERMKEDDWDTMIDNLITKAQEDIKAFETLRDTIGEKPNEKVDLSIEDESARAIDEYFTSKYNKPSGE